MQVSESFTAAAAAVLDRLQEQDRREREAGIRNAGSVLALAPSVARLLYLLAVQRDARTVAEFGTSHGYSTIHLAAAAGVTGGHVHTVDALPEKTALARANLHEAGLLDRVTLSTADGAEFARALPDGVDLVLVDYAADAFLPAWPQLGGKLAMGGLVFLDGGPSGYWQTGAGGALREHLERNPELLVTTLPMHKEQLLAVRVAPTKGASGSTSR